MGLRGVRGQEGAIEYLKRSAASGRISHAYLFHGPEGVGKELTAKNFAKLLNCREPKGGDACDFCRDCLLIEKGTHPDLLWLRPLGPARIISIDEVRRFRKTVSLKPHSGKWKIGIFADAHTLSTVIKAAGNALLKTLEEPPPHTVIILVTSRPDQLLPTIVSRCQAVRFPPMPERRLAELLASEYDMPAPEAKLLSRLCGGRLGAAVKALREDRLDESRAMTRSLARNERGYWTLCAGLIDSIEKSVSRSKELFEWQLAERGLHPEEQDEDELVEAAVRAFVAGETRRKQEELLEEFLRWYRDLIVWKVSGREDLLISAGTPEEVMSAAGAVSRRRLEEAVRLVEEALRALRRNANFHNILENLLVQLTAIERDESRRKDYKAK